MSPDPIHFHLCPTCSRSVPSSTDEHFCPNDGTRLLECCPECERPILTPFARFCAGCGLEFAKLSLPIEHKLKEHEPKEHELEEVCDT